MWRDLRICKYVTPLNRTRARDRRHIVVVAELVSFFPDTFTCMPHNSKYHARNSSRHAGMQSVSVTLLSCFSIIDKQNADTVWYFRQHQLGHHICRFYGFIQRRRTPNGIPITMTWSCDGSGGMLGTTLCLSSLPLMADTSNVRLVAEPTMLCTPGRLCSADRVPGRLRVCSLSVSWTCGTPCQGSLGFIFTAEMR